MRHFLIDTDTASDDAVALIMALREPNVVVEAITVVAGNVGRDQAVQNALYTVELCASSVPVHAGAAAPLQRPLRTAEHVHGADGFGDIGLPLAGRDPASEDAVGVLLQTSRRLTGRLTLVTLGPLTNIALALQRDPGFAARIEACFLMGGVGQGPGNITPVAEFNLWVDPEAARAVYTSGLPIHMIGWDIADRFARFSAHETGRLRAVGTPLSEFAVAIQRTHAGPDDAGFTLPDPTTMAVALDPSIATDVRRRHVAIETDSELCRGQSVVDHVGVTGRDPNVELVLEIDRQRFLDRLVASLG